MPTPIPKFRIQVADRDSGREYAIVLDAASQEEAATFAGERGLLVGKIERCDGSAHAGATEGLRDGRSAAAWDTRWAVFMGIRDFFEWLMWLQFKWLLIILLCAIFTLTAFWFATARR